MPSAGIAHSLLLPFDRARTALFVRATRVELLRAVLLDKRRRVPALLLAHAGAALVLSVMSPTLLLLLGPLLLGVPHVIADLRYLVLRPALPRATRTVLLGGCATLLATRVLELLGVFHQPRLELALASLWVASVIALGAREGRRTRAAVASALAVALALAAWVWPRAALLALGHGHNVVALVLWVLVFCGSRRRALGVVALLLALCAVLLTTPLAWWGFSHGVVAVGGLHSFAAADSLAPGIADARLALGVVASFAFLQSVHYAAWLHAIPQEATRGDATLSFRMSFRALAKDLSRPGLSIAVVVAIAVPVAACFGPLRVQVSYLSLAAFHAYLELAALALFWVQGGKQPVERSTFACS
jgi:hypothetical protein